MLAPFTEYKKTRSGRENRNGLTGFEIQAGLTIWRCVFRLNAKTGFKSLTV